MDSQTIGAIVLQCDARYSLGKWAALRQSAAGLEAAHILRHGFRDWLCSSLDLHLHIP